jgi:hypothetical protein
MKRVIFGFVFLVLCFAAQAATLSDYPYIFADDGKFDAIYVVGEEAPALDVVSATTISTALARYPNLTVVVGTSRIDSEIPNIVYRNAIVIGSPCENKAAAILEGNPTPCYANLSGGIGYIKLFEQNNRTQLLITGLDAKDRQAAAKFLATASLQNILAKQFQVASASGSYPPTALTFANKTNESKNESEFNVTGTTQTKSLNITKPVAKPKPEKIGEYEPLTHLPERKGLFAKFWAWLISIFR